MRSNRSLVLIVVNDASRSEALAELFTKRGYSVERARDAASAATLMSVQVVDLVVVDADVAEKDNFELLRLLRAGSPRHYLPVFMLTDKHDGARCAELIRLGADDCLSVDYQPEELIARAERCLRLRAHVESLVDETNELFRLSVTDELTQVGNHRSFQERLREEFRRAQRYDEPLSLILLDLDHFKLINDQYGHPAGDDALRDVAATIKRNVRDTDWVARYGGEEFVVLLPKTSLAGSLTVAERVWQDVAQIRVGPDGSGRITVSLGISAYPNRSVMTAEQLLQTADEALYRAKAEGRNKISLFAQASMLAG